MILVDTSVWVDHFRRGNRTLAGLLEHGEVLCHPFIVGELACGNLRRRAEILRLLQHLPQAHLVEHGEVLTVVDTHRLSGTGIGWLDAHLMASTLLASGRLWTLDKPLARAAANLGLLATF